MKLKITVLSVSFIAACIALGQNTFAPEDVIDLEFTIGDSSASHSERWLMNIAGGPTTLRAQSPDYGKMGTANFNQFRKGKAYSITVEHQGTHPQYIASTQDSSRETLFNGSSWYGSDAPDYDYKALVEVSTSVGYLVKDEAQPPLLGTSNGNETNEASDKTAYIAFPKPILSFTDYTEEQVAGDPGVLVMVNDNDSNEDGAIDSGSPYPEDPDYVEILLEVELSGAVTVDEGVMRLSANTNDLRVRDPDDSLAAQTFPIEWDMSTEDGDPFRSNGKKLLLEAMAPSDEYKDVTLTFEYVNNGSTSDEAELTLLKVDLAARKKGSSSSPDDGLLVKSGETIELALSEDYFDREDDLESVVSWQYRQLKGDGSYTTWTAFGSHGTGSKMEQTVSTGGIYQIKAIFNGGAEFLYTRKSDSLGATDSSGTFNPILREGQPDFIGVVSNQWQINVRDEALSSLGSTTWARAANISGATIGYGTDATFTWFGPVWKCNIFVFMKANDAGATVPTRVWRDYHVGIPPYTDRDIPPTAEEWNESSSSTTSWTWLSNSSMPEPGYVVSRQRFSGLPAEYTHVGILDYDGTWINAGSANVNKSIHLQDAEYQPANFRKQ